jgi:hypothetical protein
MMKKRINETRFEPTESIRGKTDVRPVLEFRQKTRFSRKCGEETSPTPQMDWSLAHGLKATFDLKFLHGVCPRFSESTFAQGHPCSSVRAFH